MHQGTRIESIGLSVRATHALLSVGIKTAGDLAVASDDQLRDIKGAGLKSSMEIREYQKKVAAAIPLDHPYGTVDPDTIVIHSPVLPERIPSGCILADMIGPQRHGDLCVTFWCGQTQMQDIPLRNLSFGTRSLHTMEKLDVSMLSDLILMRAREIKSVEGAGEKTVHDIIRTVQEHVKIQEDERISMPKRGKEDAILAYVEGVFIRFPAKRKLLRIVRTELSFPAMKIVEMMQDFPANAKALAAVLTESEECLDLFEDVAYNQIASGHITSRNDVYDIFPSSHRECADTVVDRCIAKRKVKENEGFLYESRMTVSEWVDTIETPYWRNVVKDRLSGMTLQELAEVYGRTRERIRQLIHARFKSRPELEEDRYADLFREYKFTEEAFVYITGLSTEAFYYLKDVITERENRPIETILADESVHPSVRSRAREYLAKDFLIENDICYPKDPVSVWIILLKKNPDGLTEEELEVLYTAYVEEHSLTEGRFANFNSHNFCMHAERVPGIVHAFRKRYRYIDLSDRDIDDLLKKIRFYELKDIELSTKYFTDRYADVLAKYDISDEFELHNILKHAVGNNDAVRFERQPFVTFGKADRKEQILRAIRAYHPSTATELSEFYEKEYGVAAQTFRASIWRSAMKKACEPEMKRLRGFSL